MENAKRRLKRKIITSVVITFLAMGVIFVVNVPSAFAQDATTTTAAPAQHVDVQKQSVQAEVTKFALVAAALAFGLGAVGAGIAVGNVGSAAMGAIGEKPEMAGQAIIFVALAEGIMVFGFIIAILILGRA